MAGGGNRTRWRAILSPPLARTPGAKPYGCFASAGVLRGSEGRGPAPILPEGSGERGWALRWEVGAPDEGGNPMEAPDAPLTLSVSFLTG